MAVFIIRDNNNKVKGTVSWNAYCALEPMLDAHIILFNAPVNSDFTNKATERG